MTSAFGGQRSIQLSYGCFAGLHSGCIGGFQRQMAGGGRQSRLGFSCAAAVAVFFLSLSCLALLADFRGGEDDNGTFAFSTISASVGG